ncbi:MAG: TonB-dependent receptor plug domain-containing protein, partial [Gammaproteobacteria bacterium]|nr:TonB-dependent receptor plug domain-containing protein [Gammaproteobacteria bacterium]
MSPGKIIFLALVLAFPVAAQASDDGLGDAGLDEIVVVATKRATSIRDVAADITVITAAELQATLGTSLEDVFRFVPGVTQQSSGSRFGTEGITIRGIGGNRIAMELDGVSLSDHFAIGNFANATRDFADTGLIGQVEVLRGPASAVYGSSALGGVVAMQTLQPSQFPGDDKLAGRASLLYRGLDASRNTEASVALRGPGTAMILAG